MAHIDCCINTNFAEVNHDLRDFEFNREPAGPRIRTGLSIVGTFMVHSPADNGCNGDTVSIKFLYWNLLLVISQNAMNNCNKFRSIAKLNSIL